MNGLSQPTKSKLFLSFYSSHELPLRKLNHGLDFFDKCPASTIIEIKPSIKSECLAMTVHTESETRIKVRTPADLGKAVRRVRKNQNITQADMAAMIGKSHVLLRDIEKGTGTVSLGSVLLLLEELGVHVYLDLPNP